jgi:hypothetical protein
VSDSEGFEHSCQFGREDVFNRGLFNDYVSFSGYITCRVVELCVNKVSANPTIVDGLRVTTRNS